MLKPDPEAAATPFLQQALVAAASAWPEGSTSQATAESAAAVAASLKTARARAGSFFLGKSAAPATRVSEWA